MNDGYLSEPRTLCIGVDLDAILIDLIRPWLAWYNHRVEPEYHLTVDQLTVYDIERFTKPGFDIYKFFDGRSNYAECPVLPGASEALEELKDQGHDIIITTAPVGQSSELKWVLTKKVAPWLSPKNVMVGARKERLHFDVFIDDSPKNIIKQRNKWGKATKILTIAYPYNQSCRTIVDFMAEDYNNTAQAWRQICNYIHNYCYTSSVKSR